MRPPRTVVRKALSTAPKYGTTVPDSGTLALSIKSAVPKKNHVAFFFGLAFVFILLLSFAACFPSSIVLPIVPMRASSFEVSAIDPRGHEFFFNYHNVKNDEVDQ